MPGTTAFPSALDTYSDIAPNTSESVVSHSAQHNDHRAAVLALQTKVGIDGSADPTSFDYRIDGLEDALISLGIADVAGLQTALDGKASASHTHAASDIASGELAAARLAGGTPAAGHVPTYQGDGSVDWAAPTGGSGDVASDAIWDAAGDLAVGTGANTAARLPKGTDSQVLTIVAGAVAWAAASGGASISLAFDGGSIADTHHDRIDGGLLSARPADIYDAGTIA